MKAYAVTENDEGTGGIIFAEHAVVARRLGANEYGDGEFSYVSCRRAPWADQYHKIGVPAWVMVDHGWHFECGSCGRRIDSDLNIAWENEVAMDAPRREVAKARRRYKNWSPRKVIGGQYGLVFCDRTCDRAWRAEQRERARVEQKWLRRFKAIVAKRFPASRIVEDDDRWLRPHVYVARNRHGLMVLRQMIVSFEFPGMKIAPASLRCDGPGEHRRKTHYSCCVGDQEAFEAYAAASRSSRTNRECQNTCQNACQNAPQPETAPCQ